MEGVGTLCIPHEKSQTTKFFSTWGLDKRLITAFNWLKCLREFLHLKQVLSGPLTGISAWVGFCISSPQQCVKYQLRYLNCIFVEGGLYEYPMKNSLRSKFLPTWGLSHRYSPSLQLTYVSVGISGPQTHSRVSNINFWYFIFLMEGEGIYKYPMKYSLRQCSWPHVDPPDI